MQNDAKKDLKHGLELTFFHEIPVFRWFSEMDDPSEEQLEAFISNLAVLGKGGKHIAELYFTKRGLDQSYLQRLYQDVSDKPTASYETFRYLGFNGDIPDEFHSPAEELKAIKKSHEMDVRGLYYTDRGHVGLNANVFASYILERINLILVPGRGYFYYEDLFGKWCPINERDLGKICRDILHEAVETCWCSTWHSEYLKALQLEVKQVDELDTSLEFINLRNGMLKLDTLELFPHSPKYYSSVQIKIDFDPNATCPKFIEFLSAIFDQDEERIQLIQELMGYMVTKDMRLQKAVIFHGRGANGKSVLAEIIRLIAGPENTSHVPLNRLSSRFGLDDLPGKTVNISAENELGDQYLNTQQFKSIVGQDVVNLEVKYRDSCSIRLFCKLLILVNKLPKTQDHSHGYYRRLIIVPFDRVFSQEEQDKDLTDKLIQELNGILLFALQGYQRLLKNDLTLTESKMVREALKNYKEQQNPVIEFIREEVKHAPGVNLKRSLLHPAYQIWCRKHGYEDLGLGRFWDLFRSAEAELGLTFPVSKIKGIYHLNNVELVSQKTPSSADSFRKMLD
ncbi:MAG: DNA primase [Firmicutes bacterium]|nr:DNA primase [Bacillota bacterium]